MSNTSRPGRGWFLAATILMGLTGVAHTLGQFGADPPQLQPALDAMRSGTLAMGMGMTPSIYDVFSDLAFTMSVTFFALTAMNLLLIYSVDATTRLRRTAAGITLIWLGAFIGLAYLYRVPPPLISALVIWPLFLVAYIKSKD